MSVFVGTEPGNNAYIRTRSPWQNFESLMLQHPYKTFQGKIIKGLMQKKKADLEEYKTKTRDYPHAILEEDLEKLAYQNTIFLNNSLELWQEAKKVSDSIKPILIYYSWQQFSAFFIYTLFKWPMPSKGHGVHPILSEEIADVQIQFLETGFYRRLTDTFVVLGHPTAYAAWIPLGSNQGLLFVENQVDSRIPIGRVKLLTILDFDARKFEKDFKLKFQNRYYGPHVDNLLTDFLVVFLASNFARYRPQLWNDVLDGKGEIEAKFNLRVKNAYRNYDETHNCLLDQVWSEFLKWKV